MGPVRLLWSRPPGQSNRTQEVPDLTLGKISVVNEAFLGFVWPIRSGSEYIILFPGHDFALVEW